MAVHACLMDGFRRAGTVDVRLSQCDAIGLGAGGRVAISLLVLTQVTSEGKRSVPARLAAYSLALAGRSYEGIVLLCDVVAPPALL
jgi:hypothetical protein